MCTRYLGLGLLLFAASLARAETRELDGVWQLVAVESEDGKVDLPEPRPLVQFQKEKLIYGRTAIAKVTTDAMTKPQVIDLRFDDADELLEGIYAIEGETLRICLNGRSEGVKERPLDFSLVERPSRRVLHLERTKADDAGEGSGYLGVALGINDERPAVTVQMVLADSPAKKAGLQAGDQVVSIDRSAVTTLREAIDLVRRAKPGAKLALRISRDGKEQDILVTVGLVPFRVLAGLV